MTNPTAPTQSDDPLESCYVALWEAIENAATARRIERKFKDAIQAQLQEAYKKGFIDGGLQQCKQ